MPFVLALSLLLLAATPRSGQADEFRHVDRVIDGDTVVLDGNERVRLIGVDTPETVHPRKAPERYGKEASDFTRRLVEGKRVLVEYEPSSGRTDRYGRTLGYIYLPDGSLLNVLIIERGFGHAYTRFPFSKMDQFRAAERRARELRAGLWSEFEAPAAAAAAESSVAPVREARTGGLCVQREECCKVCGKGSACGGTCISASRTCSVARGCACDASEVCR
jgi:endonuclease YncB( thermonuclease family)